MRTADRPGLRPSMAIAVAVAGIAALIAVSVAVATHGTRHPAAGPAARSAGGSADSASVDTGKITAAGNRALLPAHGAYLGAYVQPASYTPRGFITAVQSFQRSVGHAIDLVHLYDQWNKPFPTETDKYVVRSGKVLLLTWGGSPDTKAIIAGRDDAMIRQRAEAVKQLGRPILMEFRHEMDRPNLQWTIHGAASYIAAWDHVRAIFTQIGATNVSWVWCPTGYGFQVGRAQAFYPGNNEVDWVCADIYADSTAQPLSVAAAPFLSFAKQTGKPILIGEFAVKGGGDWSSWLSAAGTLAESDPQIRGMAYFDGNGVDSNGHPFKYQLGPHPRALSVFRRLLGKPFFHPPMARPREGT